MRLLFIIGLLCYGLGNLVAPSPRSHWSGSPVGKVCSLILYGRGEVAWHWGENPREHENNEPESQEEGGDPKDPHNPALLRTIQLLEYAHHCDPSFYSPTFDLASLLAYRQNNPEAARQLLEESIPQVITMKEKISLQFILFQILAYKMRDESEAKNILQIIRAEYQEHSQEIEPSLQKMIEDTLKKYL